MQRPSAVSAPSYTMGTRTNNGNRDQTPGVGAYNIDTLANKEKGPAYSIRAKHTQVDNNATPGVGSYNI
mgnify:CR=1 FL=1